MTEKVEFVWNARLQLHLTRELHERIEKMTLDEIINMGWEELRCRQPLDRLWGEDEPA